MNIYADVILFKEQRVALNQLYKANDELAKREEELGQSKKDLAHMYKMKKHADLMFVQTADELNDEKVKNEQASQLLNEQDDYIALRREGFIQ